MIGYRIVAKEISEQERNSLQKISNAKFHKYLDPDWDIIEDPIVIVGAKKDDQIVGLMIADLALIFGYSIIFCFETDPNYDYEQIAKSLFNMMAKEVKKEGGALLFFRYEKDQSHANIVEKIIKKQGWEEPYIYRFTVIIDRDAFNPPWIKRKIKLPEDYEEFFWKDVTPKERKIIKRQNNQRRFPANVFPYLEENKIEYLNSLGLKYKNEIIGWMVTHRVEPDMIRYSAFYIESEFKFRRLSIKLLIDAINIQKKSDVKWAKFEINYTGIDESWQRGLEKHLIPLAHHTFRIFESYKKL